MKFSDIDIIFNNYEKYEIWLRLVDVSGKVTCDIKEANHPMIKPSKNILLSYKGILFAQISDNGNLRSKFISEYVVYNEYILSFIREIKLENII